MCKLFLFLNCRNKIENENEALIDIKLLYKVIPSASKILHTCN